MTTLLLPVIFAAGVCTGQAPIADSWPERLEPEPQLLLAEAAGPAAWASSLRCERLPSTRELHSGI